MNETMCFIRKIQKKGHWKMSKVKLCKEKTEIMALFTEINARFEEGGKSLLKFIILNADQRDTKRYLSQAGKFIGSSDESYDE